MATSKGHVSAKRKSVDEAAADNTSKKTRSNDTRPVSIMTVPSAPSLLATYELLQPKYEVATARIASYTSINKKVSLILDHLGRFDWTDMSVKAGLVFLWCSPEACSKMVSVGEIAKRRMHEKDQKWYQYCRVQADSSESRAVLQRLQAPEGSPGQGRSKAENEALEADDEDDFEQMLVPFVRDAMRQPISQSIPHVSLFLSRVPIPELKDNGHYSLRTNESIIEHERKKRWG